MLAGEVIDFNSAGGITLLEPPNQPPSQLQPALRTSNRSGRTRPIMIIDLKWKSVGLGLERVRRQRLERAQPRRAARRVRLSRVVLRQVRRHLTGEWLESLALLIP